jgi:hypothetical protein
MQGGFPTQELYIKITNLTAEPHSRGQEEQKVASKALKGELR